MAKGTIQNGNRGGFKMTTGKDSEWQQWRIQNGKREDSEWQKG